MIEELEEKTWEIYRIFQSMGYEWWSGKPTLEDIRSTIQGLVDSCEEHNIENCSTGRIMVTREIEDDGTKYFEVSIRISGDQGTGWD